MVRISEEDYEKIMSERGRKAPESNRKKKKSKFGNVWVVVDGIKFQSQKEANRYCELKLLRIEGSVINFFRQVPIDLPGGIVYKLDFLVLWADGKVSYEDVKGFDTPVSRLKRKQAENLYLIKIKLP